MKIKKNQIIAAAVTMTVAVLFSKVYIDHRRTEMVFNEADIPYEEILKEGLPDGTEREKGIGGIVRKILGFDEREPETIIKSYSSIFDETEESDKINNEEETNRDDSTNKEEIRPTEQPKKDSLPTFAQIAAASGISVSNATSYSVSPDELCAEPLGISLDSGPQILIVHTHTTECFVGDGMSDDSERTTNSEKNMVSVGEEMKAVFESYGIECVHDETIHDYPTYQGAYNREYETVEKNLKQYPSIKMVFDVHRDAFVYKDGSKLRVACDINGVPTAKAMIVCGTDSMGLEHPNWRENFKLASKIQSAAELMYPGMMRPINLRRERFNMHTTNGSLLFEIGSNGNTLDEAKEGGKNLARAISAVLLNQG